MKVPEVIAGLAESDGSLLPGLWRDSLHITCSGLSVYLYIHASPGGGRILPGFPSISSFLFVFVPCLTCLVRLSSLNVASCRIVEGWFKAFCLQCFDAVGWAAGRASGL